MEQSSYTELLPEHMPAKDIIPLPFSDFLGAPGFCYTREEYCMHMDYLHILKKQNQNYHLKRISGIPENLTLYGKENIGIFLSKNDDPGIVFTFDEPYITAAFLDYLIRR